MDSADSEISHVSDTALMVAAARAMETARPDGLVRDPYAERLAGERGMAFLKSTGRSEMLNFGIGIRSRFLDELLTGVLAEGEIDTVLVLGAGLDTRPWRLGLPAQLNWIEVDFPDMLDYKYGLLTEQPHCRLERMAADLNDAAGRAAVFARAGERTLLITEGLLMYLPAETVEAIAEGAARAGIRRWLMDLTSPEFAKRVGMSTCQSVENVRAASCLDGIQTRDVLQRYGWTSLRDRTYARDVEAAAPERVGAMMQERIASGKGLPPPSPPDDLSGVHLFVR